jgi:hypothetical protein
MHTGKLYMVSALIPSSAPIECPSAISLSGECPDALRWPGECPDASSVPS